MKFCFISRTICCNLLETDAICNQGCLSPMLDSFTLYHQSFNFKELAPDLQQRKTGFSVLEIEY